MKKKLLYAVIALLLGSAVNFACSNNKEAESEKVTDKAAKEIVDRIRGPIEKAHAAKEVQEKRNRDMEEALEEINKE